MCEYCDKMRTRNQVLESNILNLNEIIKRKNREISLLKSKVRKTELRDCGLYEKNDQLSLFDNKNEKSV